MSKYPSQKNRKLVYIPELLRGRLKKAQERLAKSKGVKVSESWIICQALEDWLAAGNSRRA